MNELLFIGEQEKGYFAEEVVKKFGLQVTYLHSQNHIQQQTNAIIEHASTTEYMVFDVEQYVDDAELIAEEIVRIGNCNNAKPIIFASGYLPTSDIVVKLVQSGLKNFIFATNLSEMKDELVKCINGYYDTNGIKKIEFIGLKEVEETTKENYNFKMIGVAGACQRIGTTTHAVQIVKHLMLNGYKACYIHMNNTAYIENLKEWFEMEEDKDMGKITYQSVDHFYQVEKLSDIKKLGYDYYVYDYGVYFNPEFNKVSFLEKDIRVFVVGSEPTELPYTYDIIKNVFYDNVKFIFNYSSPKEEDDIMELMAEKKDQTYIAPTITDKYVLENNTIYKEIIPVEDISKDKQTKKIGFFGRKRK